MQIRLATEMDLEQLVLLFDEYRQELGQGSDLSRCVNFYGPAYWKTIR